MSKKEENRNESKKPDPRKVLYENWIKNISNIENDIIREFNVCKENCLEKR